MDQPPRGEIPLRLCTILFRAEEVARAILTELKLREAAATTATPAPVPCHVGWVEPVGGVLKLTFAYPNDNRFAAKPYPASIGRIETIRFEMTLFNAAVIRTPPAADPIAPAWELHRIIDQVGTGSNHASNWLDREVIASVKARPEFADFVPATPTGGKVTVFSTLDLSNPSGRTDDPYYTYYEATPFGDISAIEYKQVKVLEQFPFGDAHSFIEAKEGAKLLVAKLSADKALELHRRQRARRSA